MLSSCLHELQYKLLEPVHNPFKDQGNCLSITGLFYRILRCLVFLAWFYRYRPEWERVLTLEQTPHPKPLSSNLIPLCSLSVAAWFCRQSPRIMPFNQSTWISGTNSYWKVSVSFSPVARNHRPRTRAWPRTLAIPPVLRHRILMATLGTIWS